MENIKLTESEIKFLKDTKWSISLYEGNYSKESLKNTPYSDLSPKDAGIKYEITLAKIYDIDVHQLYDKIKNFLYLVNLS